MAHDSFRSLTRYEDYYLTGGDLFFLVEHHVFRVHRYFFERESTYFKGKLATPASPGTTRQGTSETNAIVLDDVKVHEFARFLWVFYNPKYSLYHTSVSDWVLILSLAHRWAFPEVKALAVRELEKQSMESVDRVVVYQDNQVDRNLLIPCYAALCERDDPITAAEGRRMGIETALMIAHLREVARRPPVDCRSPAPTTFHGNDLFSLVREMFGIPPPVNDDIAPETPLASPLVPTNGPTITINGPTSTTEGASTDRATTTTTTNGHTTTPGTTDTKPPDPPSGSTTTTKTGAPSGPNGAHTGAGQSQAGNRPLSPINTRTRNTGNGNLDPGVETKDEEAKEGDKEAGGDGTSSNTSWFDNAKGRRKSNKRGGGN